MLTPTNKKNIENFDSLKIEHQRTFRHRLTKQCKKSLKDIEYILLNYDRLSLKIDKTVEIIQLTKLLKLYEDLSTLQNM